MAPLFAALFTALGVVTWLALRRSPRFTRNSSTWAAFSCIGLGILALFPDAHADRWGWPYRGIVLLVMGVSWLIAIPIRRRRQQASRP